MTAATETSSPREAAAVVRVPYTGEIHLRMATQTEIVVTHNEHFVVDRTMDFVTGRTAFTNRLMFKNKWSPLLLVTFKTLSIDPVQ